jgi:hypothetical protein
LSIDMAVRQVACAIVAAKEAALLEQRAPDRAVGAPVGGSPDQQPGSAGAGFSLRRS